MTSSKTLWDVVIVGGGAAGLSAALILARARRSVLVLDAGEPRNRFTPHMHGVLGRDGHSPLQLVADGREEVRAADGVVRTATVSSLRRGADAFEVGTTDGESYTARRVVVASGIADHMGELPGLAEQWGRGVVACPYCDGYQARGKRLGVIIDSPLGLHKVQLVRAYSDHVTLFAGDTVLGHDDLAALRARGIVLERRAITAVVSEGETLSGVRLADGSVTALDVVFGNPAMRPQDELLAQLGAAQEENFMGSWTVTDATFQTSVPGLFAVGNVVNPAALVPIAMAAGVTAAATINAGLVSEDVAAAVDAALRTADAATFWENRYRDMGRSWSGKVNAAIEREVGAVAPGTALEVGCGEGGDALWLARRGWRVTAVDIAASALAVGAAEQQPGDDISWVQADLATWQPPTRYDLVTASFLHSHVELPREEILQRCAAAVAPGGRLVVVGHEGAPSWATHQPHAMELPSAAVVRARLELDPEAWEVLTEASVERPVTAPDGTAGTISDSVLTLRRR